MSARQGEIVVRFPLRRGADLATLLEDTAAAFGQLLGGSVTAQARSFSPQSQLLYHAMTSCEYHGFWHDIHTPTSCHAMDRP